MKRLLLLLIVPLFAKSQGTELQQIFPMKDGKVYYEKIVQVDSATKEQLYAKSKSWALSCFKSQKAASQADDKELGLIAYRGYFPQLFEAPSTMGMKAGGEWDYWNTLKIYIKDNKAKIVVDDLQVGGYGFPETMPVERVPGYIEESYKGGLHKNYRQRYLLNTTENFKKANAMIVASIESLVKVLSDKNKSDFDF